MADDVKQNDEAKRSKGDSGAVARAEDLQPTWTDRDGNEHRKRILTGDRTTGKLHLGHYVGSLRNRVALQSKYDTFILMADVQALTTHWENPKILRESVLDVALDYLAIGLDPYTGGEDDGSKVKIVVQSAVPSIAELTVLYGLVVPMSLILDNPTTKAEAQQYGMGEDSSDGNSDLSWPPDLLDSCIARIVEHFPELGKVSMDEMNTVIAAVADRDDVSVDKAIEECKRSSDWPVACIDQIAVYRRAIRDELIKIKRSAGVRQMNYGFLGYPVSQAADITFVNAHLVPVGQDQVPHIELTREIVRRMNKQYGKRRRILTVPQALIGGGGTLKALDGSAKMSKSLGNAIYLSDDDASIWGQLKRAVTDPQRIRRDDPGRPEICNVFAYHQQFNSETEQSIREAGVSVDGVPEMSCTEIADACRAAKIGCVECKKQLAAKLSAMLTPIRERRAEFAKDTDGVMDILTQGTRRGNQEGNATVDRVKSAMHVDYWK